MRVFPGPHEGPSVLFWRRRRVRPLPKASRGRRRRRLFRIEPPGQQRRRRRRRRRRAAVGGRYQRGAAEGREQPGTGFGQVCGPIGELHARVPPMPMCSKCNITFLWETRVGRHHDGLRAGLPGLPLPPHHAQHPGAAKHQVSRSETRAIKSATLAPFPAFLNLASFKKGRKSCGLCKSRAVAVSFRFRIFALGRSGESHGGLCVLKLVFGVTILVEFLGKGFVWR